MLTVSGLAIAPVKALAVLSRTELAVGPDGVAEDRRLFLITPAGKIVTLRDFPALASVRPDLDLAVGRIVLEFPGGSTAEGPLAPSDQQVAGTFLGKRRAGRVVPGPPAEALSDYLGQPVSLVLAERIGVGWDEGPVTMLGSGSVEQVAQAASAGRDPRRFRMTVTVDGTAPFEEDTWVGRRVGIGELVVEVTEPLGRCVVITRSPDTGTADWNGLRALARRRGPTGITLGVVTRVVRPGTVRLGDRVAVDVDGGDDLKAT
ncbi:MOSC domain-containing protein [Frankia tisae]|uniref:MOSC domain-containing protein n=1 Tax=Frankia tisae TaxID=2950104 RepID=UPI0021C0130E|nr:MOSC N-terminal beta barrel domain-containing protein [Frankia tisae]